MTRRPPVSARALLQLATAAGTAVVVAVLVAQLHAHRPTRELPFLVEAGAPQRGRQVQPISCQRVLPDRMPALADIRPPRPIGRVRSGAVVACPDNFDPGGGRGPLVQFVGEVVGDVLQRRRGTWVLINDDAYALEHGPLPGHGRLEGLNTGLAVWLPDAIVPRRGLQPGRPGRRGDILRVRGRIHRTDPADGGGLTLRAEAAEVIADAQAARPPFDRRQAVAAGLLAAIAAAVAVPNRAARP